MKIMRILSIFLFFLSGMLGTALYAVEVPISLFPLKNYDQNINTWLDPRSPDYQTPLLNFEYQKDRLKEFYTHYFSSDDNAESPWSEGFVNRVLADATDLDSVLKQRTTPYDNEGKNSNNMGYGENFRPHSSEWILEIRDNMDLPQFKAPLKFDRQNRGILTQNAHARALPTLDPHFYHFSLPGNGYPFDNLQMSALWAGTPVYIIGQTRDKSWSYVMTPETICWVQSEMIAKADPRFIKTWQEQAQTKLAAITKTEAPVIDYRNRKFLFKGFVGAIFPYDTWEKSRIKLLIPVKDNLGQAQIRYAWMDEAHASPMPLKATPANFAKILNTLQNRPYGWGGHYFYNDCSAEMKSLYTPFGIWLPRHSSNQVEAGKTVDKSSASVDERMDYLRTKARPLTTIVYNSGHVFMYLGTYPNPNAKDHSPMIMTYQNMWGLRPADKSRRAVIGQAVFLPLLRSFPEDPALNSQANNAAFQVIHLEEKPTELKRGLKFDLRGQSLD